MNVVLNCEHCGNKASHTILKEEVRKEKIHFDSGPEIEVDINFWFVKCNTCELFSLFSSPSKFEEDATSLYPSEKKVSIFIPKEIKLAYIEAQKVKKISQIAFIILIRRALDILCKYEKAIGKNLYSKIKNLGEKDIIPSKLADMADLIRLLGNEGAHDSKVAVEDVEIELLDEFFQAIIEYVYVAPNKIDRLKLRLKM